MESKRFTKIIKDIENKYKQENIIDFINNCKK